MQHFFKVYFNVLKKEINQSIKRFIREIDFIYYTNDAE